MVSDNSSRPTDEGSDKSTRILGVIALAITATILVLLVAGGFYWWFTRSPGPAANRLARSAFTGKSADRIELSKGALKDWNVLLVSADTLRADHVGCYGNHAISTPTIDGLARQGVLFKQAITPAPITLAAHTSMLTGLNPPHHGVRSNGFFRLRAGTHTLASVLKGQGYATGGVVGAFVLDSRFGLNQGFDTYNDDMKGGEHPTQFGYPERRAEVVSDVAIEWLRQHGRGKFFLFVHYFDPHFPYTPPAPFSEQYKTNPYDGEIAYVDQQLARLLAVLNELDVRRRTLIIFTADHGESLGEHGEHTHALLIYDATQHVPLIFSAGAPFPQNRIVTHQVGSIDIVPTVLALLGVPPPGALDGMNLLEAPPAPLRPIYIETLYTRLTHNWAPLLGVRRSDFKFIYAPKPEVYDLQTDPRELNNLYTGQRTLAAELYGRLRSFVGADPDTAADVQGNLPMDEETRRKLQALSYVAPTTTSRPTTTRTASLPDPKDMIQASLQLLQAEELASQNRWKEAEQTIRGYLQLSRNDPEGSHIAGQIYRQLGQYDEALKWFTRAASQGYHQAEAFAGVGSIYVIKKDLAKAEEAYGKALQIDPHNTTALLGMGTVYGEQKREAEAMQFFQDALKFGQGLNAGMAYVGISNLHRKAGRMKEADEAIAKAIAAEPSNPVIAKLAATLSERGGNVNQAIEQLRKAADSRPTVDGLLKLGKLLNQQKQHAEAAKYLNKALSLDASAVEVHYELGCALLQTNQIEPAAEHFYKAVQLSPKHVGALSELGKLFARAGKLQDAEMLMTQAVEAEPNSPVARYNLGLVLANRQA
jgi:arylsulfatase A-like enzyme/Flp pilus assembly protein TadD